MIFDNDINATYPTPIQSISNYRQSVGKQGHLRKFVDFGYISQHTDGGDSCTSFQKILTFLFFFVLFDQCSTYFIITTPINNVGTKLMKNIKKKKQRTRIRL